MKKKFIAIGLVCLLSAFPASAKLFDISEYTLSNGARLLVVENHKAPIVKHMVWYRVGAVDEKPGKGGAAHLLEHLMFRGTEKVPGSEFNRLMQINGADSNAFTSLDYTAYHQSLDVSRLELAMALEADRMANLDFSDEAFAAERDIVYQERKQVVENQPLSAFAENMRRNLWQTHPYARPVTGTEEEILSLTGEDVMDVYRRYYVPNNAVIVISGDIEPQTAYRLAEKYYGKVPAGEEIGEKSFPAVNPTTRTRLEMKLPRVELPRIVRRYVADSYNTGPENIYAATVLATYLGEGDTSELYKELVVKRKVALAAAASYDYASRSYGTFSLSAVPAAGVSPGELQKTLDRVVNDAVSSLTDEKLEKVKNKMLAGLVYLRDNPNDAAYIVGSLYTVGMTREDIENYADNIRAVDVAAVKKAAEKILKRSAFAEGAVEPLNGEGNDE